MISFNTCACLIVVCIAVQIHSLPQTQQKSTNGKNQPKRQPPTADELVQINGETVSHKFLDVFCSNMV